MGNLFFVWEERGGEFKPIYVLVCRNTLWIFFSWFVGMEEFIEDTEEFAAVSEWFTLRGRSKEFWKVKLTYLRSRVID